MSAALSVLADGITMLILGITASQQLVLPWHPHHSLRAAGVTVLSLPQSLSGWCYRAVTTEVSEQLVLPCCHYRSLSAAGVTVLTPPQFPSDLG